MGPSPPKKKKLDHFKKRKFYDKQSTKKHFLEVGQKGIVVTCNFREKECVRETYGVLNEYYDRFYGDDEVKCEPVKEEDDDISKQLTRAIEEEKFQKKEYKFQLVDCGTTNFMFIKATDVEDIVSFAVNILRDVEESKRPMTRHVLRFVPIEAVTKANMRDIQDTAGKLFDKHFLKEPKTFAVMCNRRLNNSISRDEVIKELAAMVSAKNINNKVDLKNPQLSVLVEVVKGHALISVLPHFYKLKKYNLAELNLVQITNSEPKEEGMPESSEKLEKVVSKEEDDINKEIPVKMVEEDLQEDTKVEAKIEEKFKEEKVEP